MESIEIIAATKIVPTHDAQVLIHLRMSGLRLGLLVNLHARLPSDCERRLIV